MGFVAGSPEDVGIWGTYAQSYDRVLPILPFYQEVVGRHVTALCRPGIRRVIDVGAGTGNVTLRLAALGLEVVAVDNCREMLDQLRAKAAAESRGSVSIVEQDAASLAHWPDGAFDAASVLLAFFAMHHAREALQEVVRVVRSGGRVVITETKACFQLQPLLDFVEQFLQQNRLQEDLRQDWERVRGANVQLNPGLREARLCAEEIARSLEQAGFRITERRESHLGQCETIWAEKPSAGPQR